VRELGLARDEVRQPFWNLGERRELRDHTRIEGGFRRLERRATRFVLRVDRATGLADRA